MIDSATVTEITVAPISHRAHREGVAIVADSPWSQISDEVFAGQVVILKGAYDAALMMRFRDEIERWGRSTPFFPPGVSASAQPAINFHRIDDGSVPSPCPHVLHQYGLKSIADLPTPLRDLADEIAQTMCAVQNLVGRTSLDVSLTSLYLKVLHYPSGGGFLAEHQHPLEPQGIGLITSLSRLGKDLARGGTTFRTPFGFVDSGDSHDIGDIAMFRYDLKHAVPPVEPPQAIDWSSSRGKWSAVLELRDTYLRSHKFA